jgi:hypothetical protein
MFKLDLVVSRARGDQYIGSGDRCARVNQNQGESTFATLLQELLNAHQILAGSRVLGEFGHPLAAVEFLDGGDDRFRINCNWNTQCLSAEWP